MRKNWILYTLALILCVVFYVFYYNWVSALALTMMVAAPLFSLLVSLPSILSARLLVTAPASTPLGVSSEAAVTVFCRKWLPVGCVRCRLVLSNLTYGQHKTIPIRLSAGQMRTVPLSADHCGCIRAAVEHGRIYDYLGLFSFPVPEPSAAEMLILPIPISPKPAPELEITAPEAFVSKQGGFSEFHEVRPFRQGDSLRDVHWKLTAKAGDLILREAMVPQDERYLLSLQLQPTPEGNDSCLGQLVWVAEALCQRQKQCLIRLYHPKTSLLTTVPIAKPADLQQFLEELLRCSFQSPIQKPIPHRDVAWYFAPSATREVDK